LKNLVFSYISNFLDHPLNEIRERAIKSLALKLSGHLVSCSELITAHPEIIGTILVWINERQKTAPPELLQSSIQILKSIAEDEEGRQIECKYGCVEFLVEYRKFAPHFISTDLDTLIAMLLKTRRHVIVEPIPEPIPVKPNQEKIIKKDPFEGVSSNTNKKSPLKEEKRNPEICEFPYIQLSEQEEKMIFDLNVVIRYGDPSTCIKACEQLDYILDDFPIEIFLQRTDLLKNMLYRLENEKEFAFQQFAVPVLFKFAEKLKRAYNIFESSFSRPSQLPALEKLEHKVAKVYLEGTYPAVFSSQYENTQTNETIAKPQLLDSMSHLNCLGNIGKSAIRAMKDINKMGLSMLLFKEILITTNICYKTINERLVREFYIPICQAFVEIIQNYNILEVSTKYEYQPIIFAAISLCQYMDDYASKMCFKMVPKFFSALEEAAYYSVFEEGDQFKTLEFIMNSGYNETVTNSLQKVKNIVNSIKETKKYQQEKLAEGLARGVKGIILENEKDFENAINYLKQLVICLEFYSTRDSCLEEVFIKCIKRHQIENTVISFNKDLVSTFVNFFKSPNDLHKEKLLKAFSTDLKQEYTTLKLSKDSFCEMPIPAFLCLPEIIDILISECAIKGTNDLQVLYFQILVLIIENECKIEYKKRFVKHLGVLQGLSHKYKELFGIIAKIEQVDKYANWLRVLRDLFSNDEENRKFSTLALKQKYKIETIISDFSKETGQNIEELSKLGKLNIMQINEFDVKSMLNLITREDNLDYSVRKSALEQLSYYLTDSQCSVKDLLFESKNSLFSNCLRELLNLQKEMNNATNKNLDLALHPAKIWYISQCMKYIWMCFIYYNSQDSVSSLFKQLTLYNLQDIGQASIFEKIIEVTILGMTSKNKELKWNSMVLLYLLIFNQYFEVRKDKEVQWSIYAGFVILSGFQNILSSKAKPKQNDKPKSEILCNEKEKRLVELLLTKNDQNQKMEEFLNSGLVKISEECQNLESYQNVMKSLENYENMLFGRVFSAKRIYPDENLILGFKKVISLLPIAETEVQFLSDFMCNLSQIINALLILETPKEFVNPLIEALCKTLEKDVFPFLYEVGTNIDGKREYIKSLLDLISQIITLKLSNPEYKSCIEYFNDQDFVNYLEKLVICYPEDEWIKRKIIQLILHITGPLNLSTNIMKLHYESIVKNIVCSLNATEFAENFSGTEFINIRLCIIQQLLKYELDDNSLAGNLDIPKEISEKFQKTTLTLISEYKSFTWLSRFLTHRHTKVFFYSKSL